MRHNTKWGNHYLRPPGFEKTVKDAVKGALKKTGRIFLKAGVYDSELPAPVGSTTSLLPTRDIQVESEFGLLAVGLEILSIVRDASGATRLHAGAHSETGELGFTVVLPNKWQIHDDETAPTEKPLAMKLADATVLLESQREPSNRFVRFLDNVFECGLNPTEMRQGGVHFAAVDLGDLADVLAGRRVTTSSCSMKLSQKKAVEKSI